MPTESHFAVVHHQKRSCALLFLLAIVAWGCHDRGQERVAVSGTVTYRGLPIKYGEIRFRPIKGTSAPVSGASIVDGRYNVDARGGVPVGTHQICIEAFRVLPVAAKAESPGTGADLPSVGQEQYIAEKYNRQSDLEIIIPSGSAPIIRNLDLID